MKFEHTQQESFEARVQVRQIRCKRNVRLNRGESRHELARRLFFADQGEFRTGDYEELMNKANCLGLLSNAVLVWNTAKLQRIVEQLRASGSSVNDDDLSRISPLAHAHVLPNGTYHFDRPIAGDSPSCGKLASPAVLS